MRIVVEEALRKVAAKKKELVGQQTTKMNDFATNFGVIFKTPDRLWKKHGKVLRGWYGVTGE